MLERLDEEAREKLLPFMKSEPPSMEQLLNYYEEIELPQYLKQFGLTGELHEKLKALFLR